MIVDPASPSLNVAHEPKIYEKVYTQPLFLKYKTTSVAQLVSFFPIDGDPFQLIVSNEDFNEKFQLGEK